MIEVEKKFVLTPEQEQSLLKGANPTGTYTFTDTYYDRPEYPLITTDRWLRIRDGQAELKVPLEVGASGRKLIDQYEEITDEKDIRHLLGIPGDGDFKEDLIKAGFIPLATLVTTRRKYSRPPFVLDLDEVDFGYTIAEIEYMVASKEEVEGATKIILDFAAQFNLKVAPVRGKFVEYLRRFQPDAYKALQEANVLAAEDRYL